MYDKKVMEYFLNPKNVGVIKDADGIGQAGNILCGDVMFLFIKVEDNEIIDAKFKTFGCAAAIATSSVITELVKRKTIDEALRITKDDIIKELGGLPPIKIHCSLLAVDALREAIYSYFKKTGKKIPEWLEKEHERIVKTYGLLEERYGEFVKKQIELLEKEL